MTVCSLRSWTTGLKPTGDSQVIKVTSHAWAVLLIDIFIVGTENICVFTVVVAVDVICLQPLHLVVVCKSSNMNGWTYYLILNGFAATFNVPIGQDDALIVHSGLLFPVLFKHLHFQATSQDKGSVTCKEYTCIYIVFQL